MRIKGTNVIIKKPRKPHNIQGSISYIIFTAILQLLVMETHFYWLHRLSHTSPWYEIIHKVHKIRLLPLFDY